MVAAQDYRPFRIIYIDCPTLSANEHGKKLVKIHWKCIVLYCRSCTPTFVALCGVGSGWLLKTGLAGVWGQVGDPISKSSCIGVLPADDKWLWLYVSFRFGVEHCGSGGSDAETINGNRWVIFKFKVMSALSLCSPAEALEIVLCWLASSIVVPSGPVVMIDVTGCCDEAEEPDEMPLSCDSGIPSNGRTELVTNWIRPCNVATYRPDEYFLVNYDVVKKAVPYCQEPEMNIFQISFGFFSLEFTVEHTCIRATCICGGPIGWCIAGPFTKLCGDVGLGLP